MSQTYLEWFDHVELYYNRYALEKYAMQDRIRE